MKNQKSPNPIGNFRTVLLPVLSDLEALANRLGAEEKQLRRNLAELEASIRKFQDFEKPSFDSWLRVELGPGLMVLEDLMRRLESLRFLAYRVEELVRIEGYHPREALYLVTASLQKKPDQSRESPQEESSNSDGTNTNEPRDTPKNNTTKNYTEDELRARKRAKVEAKREARKAKRKEGRGTREEKNREGTHAGGVHENSRMDLVSLFRILARKLHPDSPHQMRILEAPRVLGLWMEVQEAYQTRNYEKLLAISVWLEDASENSDDSAVQAGLVFKLSWAERFNRLRSLRKSCTGLDKQILKLKLHPAWNFNQVKGNKRKKLRRQSLLELEEEIAQTQEVLTALEDFIDSIGPARPPKY